MTIEPTVTPAPKPEWPDLVTYICRDTDGDIFPCQCPREEMAENQLVHLATVTIPSSAECERKAKLTAERDALARAVEGNAEALKVLEKAVADAEVALDYMNHYAWDFRYEERGKAALERFRNRNKTYWTVPPPSEAQKLAEGFEAMLSEIKPDEPKDGET